MKNQNLVFPKHPSYDNPLVAICSAQSKCRFNFILKNGEQTTLDPGGITLIPEYFDPDEIFKIVLWWSVGTALLAGIEFLDKSGAYIMRQGDLNAECHKHEIFLEEGERIVGVTSFTAILAFHNEFQFIIAKKHI